MKRRGKPAPRVKGRVRKMQGGASGGTIASLTETLKAVAKKPSLALLLKSSFALTPGFEGPSQPTGLIPEYDSATGTWTAPFVMARSEEHTSELQSLMRTSYAVFCLK